MNKKRLAALAVAFVFIFSCGFTAFAVAHKTLGDWISIGFNKNPEFTDYSSSDWSSLTVEERRNIFESVVSFYGGTPHFTDEFLSDPVASHESYEGLINFFSAAGGPVPYAASQLYLELNGLADLGLGFYNSNGVYDDGTVADTLNDDFLDYLPNNPLPANSLNYFLSDGSYCTITAINTNVSANKSAGLSSSSESYFQYQITISLYSSDNVFVDSRSYDCWLNIPQTGYRCRPYAQDGSLPFWDFTVIDPSNGAFRFTRYGYRLEKVVSDIYYCSLLKDFSYSSDPNLINCFAFNDNGNKIDVQLNSDGVTYEGNTYSIDNSDHSVTINGDKYYITVDPSTVDDDYYNQFLKDTINNYYNYYTTNNTDFDDTDIITSLKSIFTSLERFRDDFYSNIRQISNSISTGFVSLKNSLSDMSKKLDTIISQLKNINKELGELSEDQQEENKLAWAELIDSFKNKVGWSALSQSMKNISTAFFGEREYTVTTSGAVSVDIATSDGVVSSSMPSLYFEYGGVKYDIFSCLGYLGSGIDTIKSFISVFLWIGFIISVYRSIPSILGGVSSFDDHSNNVVIDKTTGEVKRGA